MRPHGSFSRAETTGRIVSSRACALARAWTLTSKRDVGLELAPVRTRKSAFRCGHVILRAMT